MNDLFYIQIRYMSTIEIPAEQLENLKKNNRSRSLSSSSSCMSADAEHYRKSHTQHIKHAPKHLMESNLITVSLKSKENNNSDDQLAKSQREIENLNRRLNEQTALIDRNKLDQELQQQQLVYLNENKLKDLKNNQNLLDQLESQQELIFKLKTRLNKINGNEDNFSADLTSQTPQSRKSCKQVKVKQTPTVASDESAEELNAQIKRNIDVSAQTLGPNKLNEAQAKHQETASLICNIPEHHKLEDMLHHNQEQIGKLKQLLNRKNAVNDRFHHDDDLMLLEKRAEFEALDLAINNRKQQLINLELAKNRRLNDSFASNGAESFVRVSIHMFMFLGVLICKKIFTTTFINKLKERLVDYRSTPKTRIKIFNLILKRTRYFSSKKHCTNATRS